MLVLPDLIMGLSGLVLMKCQRKLMLLPNPIDLFLIVL